MRALNGKDYVNLQMSKKDGRYRTASAQATIREQVVSFLKKKRAIKEDAVIYFGDETRMRSDHQAGRSYAPAGETPVIKKTGRRFSLNMIAAISNRGHLQFMIIDGSFNSEVFQTFLQQMIKYSRRKIYFVTDGHPAHKTKKLNKWLFENKERIEVFFCHLIALN